MKLDNRTGYATRTLRRVLVAVHRREAEGSRGRLPTWKRLTVKVAHRDAGGSYTGHAYYRGAFAHLSVPSRQLDLAHFAALWRHELFHLYGIQHPDYPPAVMHCDPRPLEPVIAALGLEPVLEPAPLDPDPSAEERRAARKRERLERLLARRKRWLAKARRATTELEKIDRSLRYYEREGFEVPSLDPRPSRPKAAAKRKRRSSK